MIPPDPPVDVRVRFTDGSTQAVQTMYAGVKDGLHVWHVVEPVDLARMKGLSIGVLPPHTQVVVPGRRD